jgi:hypothetical protein
MLTNQEHVNHLSGAAWRQGFVAEHPTDYFYTGKEAVPIGGTIYAIFMRIVGP